LGREKCFIGFNQGLPVALRPSFTIGLDGYAFASFCSSAIDNGPSRFGFHSCPKTMRAVSFNIAGLKGSLAHDLFL
jgi:hypothetical protein